VGVRAGVLTLADGGGGTARHHWFEDLADHLGSAYLRYSFTRGTENEVDALVDALQLRPGHHVLDVGCGPGRHTRALAARGIRTTGVDIAERFLAVASTGAPAGATFVRADAVALPFAAAFDAVISLCQGGFGLLGGPAASPQAGAADPDGRALQAMAGVLKPGGRLAVSAFSAYFQVRWLEETDEFDAASGVNHERTTIKSEAGDDRDVDLWTSCFTPRELRLLAGAAGLDVVDIWSVTPGSYGPAPPDLEHPEFLLLARSS